MDDFTTRVSLAKIVKDNGLKEEYMPDEPEKIMISLSDVNRPGLVLAAGFYDHFEPKRIQVLGNAETMYLKKLPEELRSERLTDFFSRRPSAIIVAHRNEVLPEMIREFEEASPYPVSVVNILEFPFAGGCLGCFHCAADGTCIYKDRFDDFLREKIQTADACVYAFTIKDHSMGQRFKLFDDRQFCNGHRTVTMGKPVGYLIDGDYASEPNLRTLIEARAQVGGNYFAGVACMTADKAGAPAEQDVTLEKADGTSGTLRPDVSKEIVRLAAELAYCVRHHYNQPADFYGVGGMKIFRDLIYQMQGMMREDHRFYKEHGFYDFPQKHVGKILGMYLVGAMINNPALAKKLDGNVTNGMLMAYKRVIDKAQPKKASKSRA